MATNDLYELCCRYKHLKIVAVHMEAWNHCRLSRKDLENYISNNNITSNIFIPKDGEILNFKILP